MIFMKNKVTGISLDNGNAFVVRFAKNIKNFFIKRKNDSIIEPSVAEQITSPIIKDFEYDGTVERLKGIYASDVAKFKRILESKINPPFLSNFYRNIRTATIMTSDKLPKNISGQYANENTILVSKDCNCPRETIFHELTHLSSSNMLDNIRRVGFRYRDDKNNIDIGLGINEGYTSYFTTKLSGIIGGYLFGMMVAKTVEEIVGTNKMRELYFNATLKGLMQELQKYATEEEITCFLYNLDGYTNKSLYSKHDAYNKEVCTEYVNLVKNFLFKIIYTKLNSEEFSEEEMDNSYKLYSRRFSLGVPLGNGEFLRTSVEENMEIFNSIKNEKHFI